MVCGLYLLLSLGLGGCSGGTQLGTTAKVARVVSGQTLEVAAIDGQGLTERVRLIGIDAPDLEQSPWGNAAQKRLEELIGQKNVVLEADVEVRDRFQRRLSYVWRDGVLLNERLVAEGYALAVPRSPNTKYDRKLQHAQDKARILGVGLWNPEQPMRLTPAEFRKQYR